MNTSKYEHFAKQTNFRARGITAEGGKLVYNENKLDELNEEYKKINAIGEDINEKFTDFRSQLSAVKPVPEYHNVKVTANEIIKQNIPQEELVDTDEGTFHKIAEYPDDFDSLDLALKLAEYSEPETAGYDDIETNLKRVSRGANIYIKGHSGKVSSSDPDRENELKRRELAKQMKEYADSKLEELHKVNTKDLNVYRSANYQIEDLEETKELSSTFVKNSNEMKPEPVIDFNGIYDASQLLLFKNPVSSYLEEKNRDTEKNMLLFGEGIDTLQKMELQYTAYTTRQQHNKKQYAANYEQKKRAQSYSTSSMKATKVCSMMTL